MGNGRCGRILLSLALVIALPLASGSAGGEEFSESRLIEKALSRNPGAAASRAAVEAARARVPQAGVWPDPVFSVGVMSLPTDTFRLDQEPMSQLSVGFSQTVPYPGRLSAAERKSQAELAAAEARKLAFQEELVYQVRRQYREVGFLDQALQIVAQNLVLGEELRKAAEIAVGLGRGLQQDVLQAEVALSRMLEDQIFYVEERRRAAAELNRLIGGNAASPVPSIPPPLRRPALPDHDQLVAAMLTRNPRLAERRALAAAAEAEELLARLSPRPDVMVSVGWGIREDTRTEGRTIEQPDLFSTMISIPLPVFRNRKQDQAAAEKRAQWRQAEAEAEDMEAELLAQLEMTYSEAKQLSEQLRLLENSTIPQAHQALASSRAAYQNNTLDFSTVLLNELTVYQLALQRRRLEARYFQALAALDWLSGKPIPEIIKEGEGT